MLSLSTSRELRIMETSTHLTFHDILGSWKARWGINRFLKSLIVNRGLLIKTIVSNAVRVLRTVRFMP